MKKAVLGLALAIAFIPNVSWAADEQIKANIMAKLLAIFVEQVNGIDYINQQIVLASEPAQLTSFKTLLQNQLSATTQQITVLLNPDSGVAFGSIEPTPVSSPTPTPAPTPEPTPTPVPEPTPTPVPVPPVDTTAPQFSLFSIDKLGGAYYLRVFTDEPLAILNSTLPSGVNIEEVVFDGRRDSVFNGSGQLGYSYEARLSGLENQPTALFFGQPLRAMSVTIRDLAGNSVTKELRVN